VHKAKDEVSTILIISRRRERLHHFADIYLNKLEGMEPNFGGENVISIGFPLNNPAARIGIRRTATHPHMDIRTGIVLAAAEGSNDLGERSLGLDRSVYRRRN
jgi:hypothetical protein